MRPYARNLLAALAMSLMAVAILAAPSHASPGYLVTSTPSPAPGVHSGGPSPAGPLASKTARDLTFGIGPAFQVPTDHYLDGRPYISALSSAGGVIRDAVAVLNDSRTPVTLTVYPADAVQNGSSTFQLSLENRKPTAAGSWFTLNGHPRLHITVPGSRAAASGGNIPGRVVIPLEGRIPLNAIPGDHAAAIVAELDAHARNAKGADITLQQRLGVAVYIHLTGQLVSRVSISGLKAQWNEPGNALGTSKFRVSYTVANTGNVRLNVSTLINTKRWFVGPIQSYPNELTNIFPGSRITVTQTVSGVFGFGPWHTTATAFGTPVETAVTLTTVPASQSVDLWPVPWILIAIIVGIVLFLYLSWRLYKRWRKRRERRASEGIGRRKKHGKAAKPGKELKATKGDQA